MIRFVIVIVLLHISEVLKVSIHFKRRGGGGGGLKEIGEDIIL